MTNRSNISEPMCRGEKETLPTEAIPVNRVVVERTNMTNRSNISEQSCRGGNEHDQQKQYQ